MMYVQEGLDAMDLERYLRDHKDSHLYAVLPLPYVPGLRTGAYTPGTQLYTVILDISHGRPA